MSDGSLDRLREALERAVGSDSDAIRRLRYARSDVSFGVSGSDQRVTLRLEQQHPEVSNGSDRAPIDFVLPDAQAKLFAEGRLHFTQALESGAIDADGPARQYLEVDPILRGALREASGTQEGVISGVDARELGDGRLHEDLLAIETRDLHRAFGSSRVLRGVDLKIPEGVISVVLGPSGTGKSVLLNHVIGLMRPQHGDVLVRGRSLAKMSRAEILRLRLEVGVMFQDGALFSAMSVFDNVAFPLRQHTDLGEDAVEEIVMRHLTNVGLGDAETKFPAELSGGMKKRAGLARAMVLDPGIILCDEPDSGLDPVRTALLGDLLREQHAQIGGTMLVITHNIALAKEVGEHLSVLWKGKIQESGSAERIFESDDPFIQQFLAGAVEGPLAMDA